MERPAGDLLYISTAIPYVNARPHIGFAFEAVIADAVARYKRARGANVFFLSGTDDNSLKNVEAAERRGIPTQQLVDENAERFRLLSRSLDLSFDDFIQTHKDPRHAAAVERLWKACAASGDIYRGEYRGLYCVGCEQFYEPDELVEGVCPEHLRPLEEVREHNWFFRLSRYGKALAARIESGELTILPPSRRTEILSFIGSGLRDISISRAASRSRGWGLRVPGDPSQVVYVWFDALTNYISGLDYASGGSRYHTYWIENPNRVHVIGKGILRFHAAYWPAMLMSAGIPLPTTLFVHGYLTVGGLKISKSLGNTVDPDDVSRDVGADALRYYLMSQFEPAADGDFSLEALRAVYRNDLADQLGNLVSRVASMVLRYFEGRIPSGGAAEPGDKSLLESTRGLLGDVDAAVEGFELHRAVRRIWDVVREANRYVVEQQPWKLAAEPGERARHRLATVIYNLAEAIRIVAALSAPFLPATAAEIAARFSLDEGWDRLCERTVTWGRTQPGRGVDVRGPLFPK